MIEARRRPRSVRMAILGVAALAAPLAVLASACATGFETLSCEELLTRCPGDDEAAKDTCASGRCVPLLKGVAGWQGPILLGLPATHLDAPSDASGVPSCPEDAPVADALYEVPAAKTCDPCTCSAPVCELPAGMTASTLSACPNDGPGAVLTRFEAPPAWDGACVAPQAVPPERVGAIAIDPVTVRPCAPPVDEVPHDTGAPKKPPVAARACLGEPLKQQCASPDETCFPKNHAPDERFLTCIMAPGEIEACPFGLEYTERYVFSRTPLRASICTPCTCETTAPSDCQAWVTSYRAADCTASIASTMMENVEICVDPAPGIPLGSMSATWIRNDPGACEPRGGELIVDTGRRELQTYCCLPPE